MYVVLVVDCCAPGGAHVVLNAPADVFRFVPPMLPFSLVPGPGIQFDGFL